MRIKTLSGGTLVVLVFFLFSTHAFSATPEFEPERAKHIISWTEDVTALGASNGKDTLKRFSVRIAGTYLVTRQVDAGPSRILTIFADGNLTSIQSIQFGGGVAGGGFSNQQGRWRRVGHHEIEATVLDLSYAPLTGDFLGTAIAHYNLQFDGSLQTVTGEVKGKVFSPGVDPLAPGETKPIGEFSDVFHAQRVTVGNSAAERD